MKFLSSCFIFLFLLAINSCKNDLKLNAPYKEIPSIYAVLNPQDKIQTIRINKVFLGEGDANQMAQVADSINYPAGEITVTLERTEFGIKQPATPTGNKQVITFTESEVTTGEGAFNRKQKVYVTSDKLFTTGIYQLTVKNNKTGNVFTAKATAIDSVKNTVTPLSTPYYPYPLPQPQSAYVDYKSYDGSVFVLPNGAAAYQLTIRVHFYDMTANGNYYKYVDYVLGNKSAKDLTVKGGQSFVWYSFKSDEFYNAMGVGLSKMGLSGQIAGRKAYKIQYIIHTTTQDYMDYLQYVTPSLSISQNKPLYSNFDNRAAIGLFTFRSRYSVEKEMATFMISEFAYSRFTCTYDFFTADDQKPGCK